MNCLLCSSNHRNAFCSGCGKKMIKTDEEELNLIEEIIQKYIGFNSEMMRELFFIQNKTYICRFYINELDDDDYTYELMFIDDYLNRYHPKINEILKYFPDWINDSYYVIENDEKKCLKNLKDSLDYPFLRNKIYIIIDKVSGFDFTNLGKIDETQLAEFYESTMKYFGVSINKKIDYVLKIDSTKFILNLSDTRFLHDSLSSIKDYSQYFDNISEIIIKNNDDIDEKMISYLFNECKNLKSLTIKKCENFPENALNILDETVAIHFK